MNHKPRTSIELNRSNIIKTLKHLKLGKVCVQTCGLNKRFQRMKTEDGLWYDELHSKYIAIVRELNTSTK